MALNHCSREQIAGPLFAAKEAALGQGRVRKQATLWPIGRRLQKAVRPAAHFSERSLEQKLFAFTL